MSFSIILSLVLGVLAGGAVFMFYRRRRWVCLATGTVAFSACLAWILSPVCIPISDDDAASFSPPIETRTETGMMGQLLFQKHQGKWHHCKIRISRLMYF